jgi:hypothetical protein
VLDILGHTVERAVVVVVLTVQGHPVAYRLRTDEDCVYVCSELMV